MSASAPLIAEQSHVIDSLQLTLCALALDAAENEAVRGEALVALGKHFPKELDLLTPWITGSQITPRLKAKLLEGIAQQTTEEHFTLLRHALHHESTRVAMAAWDFIRHMFDPAVIKNLGIDSSACILLTTEIYYDAKSALGKKDMGITTLVANFFADTAVFKSFKNAGLASRIVDEFISAFGNLTLY